MMLDLIYRQHPAAPRRFCCGLARTHDEMREAQRIRFDVLVGEMGVKLPGEAGGLDVDFFDMYCEHLLLRDQYSNRAVGTYRILPPEQARLTGYHSEAGFDLANLQSLRERMVEVGRSCVRAEFRDAMTINQLWAGLADYLMQHGHEYVIGTASISMTDGGHYAASVFTRISQHHAAPAEYGVTPYRRLPLESLNWEMDVILPPLIKSYLRMGAYVCGEPAWNQDFNCAELFLLLPVSALNARYSKNTRRRVM